MAPLFRRKPCSSEHGVEQEPHENGVDDRSEKVTEHPQTLPPRCPSRLAPKIPARLPQTGGHLMVARVNTKHYPFTLCEPRLSMMTMSPDAVSEPRPSRYRAERLRRDRP